MYLLTFNMNPQVRSTSVLLVLKTSKKNYRCGNLNNSEFYGIYRILDTASSEIL